MIPLLFIGLIGGTLSGLIGIGGGTIVVPLLIYLTGMSQLTAQGTSLALFLLPLGALGFYTYYQAGHVDLKAAAFIAATFIIGSFIGSKVAIHTDEAILTKIFAIILFLISIKLFFSK